jgi:hypothetical protein
VLPLRSFVHRWINLLAIQVRALPAQVPDEEPNPQQKDHQQGYCQGDRLPMDSVA